MRLKPKKRLGGPVKAVHETEGRAAEDDDHGALQWFLDVDNDQMQAMAVNAPTAKSQRADDDEE